MSALLLGVAPTSADIGPSALNPVTVDCGDGSRISANLTIAALTKLEAVMQEMLVNPTGENCTLSHERNPEDSETRQFMIGAGSYHSDICHVNFVTRAFRNDDGLHGVQRATFPPDTPAACGGPGTLKANVTCLDVASNQAEAGGVILESTGQFASFAPPGTAMFTDGQDSPDGTPDMVTQSAGFAPGTLIACTAAQPIFPLDRGHIEVEG
jgi:hypothetical protein